MDMSVLQLFLDVCDETSISKAAAKNYVSRQALTVAMNKLESELGVDLFVRSTLGIRLTKNGYLFYEHAKEMLAFWDNAMTIIKLGKRTRESICFGLSPALIDDALIAQLIKQQAFSHTRYLRVINADPALCWKMLIEGKLDIGFTLHPYDYSELLSISVQTPFCGCYLLVSCDSELASMKGINRSNLKGHTILFPDDISSASTRISRYCEEAQAEMLEIPAIHAVQKMLVENSVGFAIVPGNVLMQFQSPKIVAKPLNDFIREMRQSIVVRQDCSEEIHEIALGLAQQISEFQSADSYIIECDGTIRFRSNNCQCIPDI